MSPKTRRLNPGLLALALALFALALTGCTGLRDESNGWSPVSAVVLPQDSGSRLNEFGILSPLDNTLTVTNSSAFELDQVILIGKEQLLITAIRANELIVDRGVNGTKAESHPGQSAISSVGELFVVFVTTKQGNIEARVDEGFEAPRDKVSYRPAGEGR